MSIGAFRAALTPLLQADLIASTNVDDTFAIVSGKLEGPVEKRDQGCIWTPRIRENPARVMEQTVQVTIRVFKAFKSRRAPESPIDPAVLELIAETIEATIKGHQTLLGPWFQRATDFDLDPDRQMVEAHITAAQLNPSV